MGSRGPVPARSDQRRRRNKPETPIETVELTGEVEIPAPLEEWHATARAWYDSLKGSGQSRFYEPSDWQNAHYCAGLMSLSLTSEKANAQIVAQVRGLMTDLLTTEGARRRAGIELVRKPAEAEPPAAGSSGTVTSMTERRRRVGSNAS